MDVSSRALSKVHPDWQGKLDFELIYAILSRIEKLQHQFAPVPENILNAFSISPESIKVVIVGQDPYPTPGDATGLAFSVNRSTNLPRSLRNIFTELHNDLGTPLRENGDLSDWVEQGVFLINRILTTPIGSPLGHSKVGWQEFTDQAIQVAARNGAIGFLMGKPAASIQDKFESSVTTAHPSPLSAHRGFFGSRPFSKINALLDAPIVW